MDENELSTSSSSTATATPPSDKSERQRNAGYNIFRTIQNFVRFIMI